MKNNFILSYKLKITYRVNTIIYSIKQIPLIKKLIPDGIYGADGLKTLGILVSIIYEIISTFLGKALYMFLMIYLYTFMIEISSINIYTHLLLFLTIIGSLINSYMFNPTNDKYYLMMLLKMNARDYTVSNFIYSIVKTIIGFLPFVLIIGLLANTNLLICLIIPLFISSMKINIDALILKKSEIKEFIKWIIVIICLILAYVLPIFNIIIPYYISLIIYVVSIILSFISLKYIYNYKEYYSRYKVILSDTNMQNLKVDQTQINKEATLNILDSKNKYNSNKEGYAYFNELFIKRHNKVLYKFVKNLTLVIIGIFVICVLFIEIDPIVKLRFKESLLNILPWLTFVMCFINTGSKVSRIFFINCDNAMLTFNFYRLPKVILSLFKERLKSIIKMNLIPSSLISIFLIILLYLSGNKDYLSYLLVFMSITSMSVFFSVHNLVIYYLFQPYNINSDLKGGTFQIVNMVTYMVCYYLLELEIPINIYGPLLVIFSGIYISVSLLLVYKFAYKTFKIRN